MATLEARLIAVVQRIRDQFNLIKPRLLPSGGTAGQALVKTDGSDYNAGWGTPASATKLAVSRTIGMTGDVTWVSAAFDGSGNVTGTSTLATVNSNVGSFGSRAAIPTITVNNKGLVTGVTTTAITGTVSFTIDGGGSPLTTGIKGDFQPSFPFTITGWTLVLDQLGSAVVEVSKATYASWPTVSAVTASAKPTVSSERKATSTTLTGWTTAVAANDVLQISISSAATATRATLMLHYTRT